MNFDTVEEWYPQGTLIEMVPSPYTMFESGVGLIIETFAGNVYDRASVQALFNGEMVWLDCKDIRRAKRA